MRGALSSLKKMMIDDLLLETHHRGTYLLVRSVTPQDRMTAVMAIVEDERGDVLMVQLYHQQNDAVGQAEDILVEGTVLILKEPYLKLCRTATTGFVSTTCRTSCYSRQMMNEFQRVGNENRLRTAALPWLGRRKATSISKARRIGLPLNGMFSEARHCAKSLAP